MKIKKILKKVLVCLLIFFTINNLFAGAGISNVSQASTFDTLVEGLESLLSSVVGLLIWPLRIVALAVGLAVDKLMSAVAYIEGGTPSNTGVQQANLTPFDIIFNTTKNEHIPLLNINFFATPANQGSIMYKFRQSIAVWYYALRTIATAILLIVLIYVGIRLALTNVSPDKKASYKKSIVDWMVSVAIIFLMQYIMLFVLYVNDALVDSIAAIADNNNIRDAIDTIGKEAQKVLGIDSIAATVVYCMIVFQTFGLFISYFNRMLTLAFLTLISPLITITYSVDKLGDGKAQALNTWLKEYVFTVLLQPFHCIIYMAFVSTAMELLTSNSGNVANQLGAAIISILCINFMQEGEKIVRKIFAFGNNGKSSSLGAGFVVAAAATQRAKGFGKGTRKAINGVSNIASNVGNAVTNAKVDAIVLSRILSGDNKKGDGTTKSVDEVKSEIRTEMADKEAEKEEKKRYGVSSKGNAEQEAKISKRAEELRKANSSLSETEARAHARAQIAKETRKSRKKAEFAKRHPTISGAKGKISDVGKVISSSETLKELGKLGKAYIASGAGFTFGSGTYGMTGKLAESVLTGTAIYRGVQGFMSSSSKTLRKSGNARLRSLGITSSAEAAARMHIIASNADKYEGADEVKKILDDLKKALRGVGEKDIVATRIQNSIQRGIANNPSADIGTLVQNALLAHGVALNGSAESQKVFDSTEKLATFEQEKGIYNDIKQAGEIGISPDVFISRMASGFDGETFALPENYKTDKEFIQDAKEITKDDDNKEEKFQAPDDDSVNKFVEDRNEADLKEFYKECDRERAKIQRQLSDEEIDLPDYVKNSLIAEMNQIIAAKTKVQDAELDREVDRLRKEANEALSKATTATTKSAQQKLDRELSRLQAEYDKYISQAEEFKGRVAVDGAKTEGDLNAQKIRLESQKAYIVTQLENLRQNS